MSEIDDRIATVWPGRPTTADVEATRLADLRAVKAEIDAVSERLVEMFGRMTSTMHSLDAIAERVVTLESAPRIVTAGSQDDDRASPAPPAPLVERMAEAIRAAPTADDFEDDSIEWWTPVARAALLVAAEELLGPVTPEEADEGIMDANGIDDANEILRARLARAKEAARG